LRGQPAKPGRMGLYRPKGLVYPKREWARLETGWRKTQV
jgi:hypothetical protein